MADFFTRAKAIMANVKNKDQTIPANPVLMKVATAFVRQYRDNWQRLLERDGLVINPADTSDPLDIGTEAGDPPVFTPSTAAVRNKLMAEHYIREIRRLHHNIFVADQRMNATAVAGDAGKTPEEIDARLRTAAETESRTELGDPDNDPET